MFAYTLDRVETVDSRRRLVVNIDVWQDLGEGIDPLHPKWINMTPAISTEVYGLTT